MANTEWIDGLKVADLKAELKKRGLAVSGKKAELAERLRAHVEEEEQGAPAEPEQSAPEAAPADAEPSPPPPEPQQEEAQPEPGPVEETEKPKRGSARKKKEAPAPSPAAAAPAPAPAEEAQPEPEPEPVPMETEKPKRGSSKKKKQASAPASAPAAAAAAETEDAAEPSGAVAHGFGLLPPPAAAVAPPEPDAPAAMEVDEPAAAAEPPAKKPVRQEKKRPAGPRPGAALTMADITRDALTQLAEETWSPAAVASGAAPAFDPDLVDKIYAEELGGGVQEPPARRVGLLELSQYLENYLWPGYSAGAGAPAAPAHLLSIVLMVNEKFKEGMPAWDCFAARPADFSVLFAALMALRGRVALTPSQRLAYLTFMASAFQSLENEMVRGRVLRLVSLPLWHSLSRGRLQLELHEHPQLAKHWRSLAKKDAKAAAAAGAKHVPSNATPEATFLPSLMAEFLDTLAAAATPGDAINPSAVRYCERFVWFLTTLLSQLPTRRFLHAVLEDKAVLIKCRLSALHAAPEGALFSTLVEGLRAALAFPIDDHTGDALSEDAVTAHHYERVQQLQRLLFKHWPKLREAALVACGTLEKRDVLTKFLAELSSQELHSLVTAQLRLVDAADPAAADPAFLAEVMVTAYERRRPQREVIESLPLYPTESLLLDGDAVPGDGGGGGGALGDGVLALPRLNLQFLTLSDYLVRNFHLFRLEAAYEVREDVREAVRRTTPHLGEDNAVHFGGWSRMAQPLHKFAVVEVRKPKVGENAPAAVTAEVTIDVRHMRPDVRGEWEELKQHDVVFLLGLAPQDGAPPPDWKGPAHEALAAAGLAAVRGGEVLEVRDQEGKLMNDFSGRVPPEEQGPPKGTLRTLTMALDPQQYAADAAAGRTDVYGSFNLLMRRHAKENNFKAVLESIRDMVADGDGAAAALPPWLMDVLLGYGDPADAQYHALDDACLHTVDFKDTFLDADHLREAFSAEYDVEFVSEAPHPPFKVIFPSFAPPAEEGGKRKAGEAAPAPPRRRLVAESYSPPVPGPYPQDAPPLNTVRFTPTQTRAIMSGVQPGLTMVVGPPGTGKTDTAVQIMHCLYHNCPDQRTLIITHSNQALNDLFQKIVERDVPPRYLLRLGAGEADLDTEEQFSRVGRVNAMLARRLELLTEVGRLAGSLGVPTTEYTCESAAHFWLLHVLSRWEKFSAAVKADTKPSAVAELFPFKAFFGDAVAFGSEDAAADLARAQGCFRHLRGVFQELEEVRPFEILKTQGDRINYLLTKQAKIVAMTCTHAALKRREFLELGFTYDNLLMEEAAQVLEIETALPMLLQRAGTDGPRLKRVILIGDHHQLPPVVKNTALQRVARMDQSLFARLVRLGAPYVELDAQGRARPSLAALYNWRYRGLGDLPRVSSQPAFLKANAGFAFDYQCIDVPDFLGRGESEPVAHFYQNLGEAEYLVSVYQYMRLLGYPAASISILTTYNGQRALLADVIERRCANHPLFGRPRAVSTVDKYQGQQNDYILLSLVRTRAFGHLRDVRRAVVALSRARLGLYVFARGALWANCYELQPAFRQLLARPPQLALVAGERHGAAERGVGEAPADALLVQGVEHMASIVQSMGSEAVAQMGNEPAAQQQQQRDAVMAEAGAADGGDGEAADGDAVA